MKRIIISILGGIVFPILIVFLASSSAEIIYWVSPQYDLTTMRVKGEPAPGIIYAPIAIPFWIYNYISFYKYFGMSFFFDTLWFRIIWIFGFNFLLYAGVTYLFHWYFGVIKQQKPSAYHAPPPPPQY